MKQLQLHVKDFKHNSIKTMPFNQPTFGEPSGCWKVVPKLIFQLFHSGGLWNSKPTTWHPCVHLCMSILKVVGCGERWYWYNDSTNIYPYIIYIDSSTLSAKRAQSRILFQQKNLSVQKHPKTARLFQHTFGTHPKPTGYTGIPFMVGQGNCLGCDSTTRLSIWMAWCQLALPEASQVIGI